MSQSGLSEINNNETYNCPNCNCSVGATYRFCPWCGTQINYQNTSGRGFAGYVPAEVHGLNWGAFFLPILWGVFNYVWLSLISIIPLGRLIMPFILLVKGNEWAWQCKKWDSIEHFKRTQKTWTIWGIIAFIVPLVLIIGIILIAIGLLGYYGIIHWDF